MADKLDTYTEVGDLTVDSIEQELFQKNAAIVDDSSYAFDLSDEELMADEPPERWVKEMGSKRVARRRFRVAKAAMLPSKDAPVALTQAPKIVTNMMKVAASIVGSKRELGAGVVQEAKPPILMPRPSVDRTVEDEPYEVYDVDSE